jgi:glycosyltransferase involved in cell wall biosynthesis
LILLQAKKLERAIAKRTYDGVICFGGCDWWYHNRAHYDLQMMRYFSQVVPVVYVNSIGIRVPKMSEGKMFFRRVVRKIKSWSRGFVKIDPTFAVVSPFVIPGKLGMKFSKRLVGPQVRLAARRMGIVRPLVWVNTPSAIEVVDSVNPAGIIYERTDRWEAFPGADPQEILHYDRIAKNRADVALYCSRMLFAEEAEQCRNAMFVDHGVEYEKFAAAGDVQGNEPLDIAKISRPRVGLVGALDPHKIDIPLLRHVAREMSDVNFILIGPSSLPANCFDLPNVHLLGAKSYDQVPAYMAACDVLMMPWNRSEWIHACNPIKLKEYLAVGRPVVTTSFDELKNYRGYVRVASTASEFAQHIREALSEKCDVNFLRGRVQQETWQVKHAMILDRLSALGLEPNVTG